MPAPERLSLFDEPEETARFFERVRREMARPGIVVSLDMSNVAMISSDALLVLRALMDDESVRSAQVSGNLPTSAAVAAQFKESGFLEHMVRPPGAEPLPPPQGLVLGESDRSVVSAEAARLVQFVTEHAEIPLDVARASYQALVELMSNTHNHAAGYNADLKKLLGERAGTRLWFASVYCEKATGRFQFAFFDLGVGILKSSEPRSHFRRITATLRGYGEVDLLKDIVDGKVGASVKRPGRGRGLEELRTYAQRDLLPGLQVFTGALLGDLATLSFRSVGARIQGTAFRWGTITRP